MGEFKYLCANQGLIVSNALWINVYLCTKQNVIDYTKYIANNSLVLITI